MTRKGNRGFRFPADRKAGRASKPTTSQGNAYGGPLARDVAVLDLLVADHDLERGAERPRLELEKGLFTMHAHRFGMNFEETIVGKLAEVYQTVHLKEFTDFPKKDEKDPTTVFTDIHFEKKSVAYEAYHLSHGFCL